MAANSWRCSNYIWRAENVITSLTMTKSYRIKIMYGVDKV